MTAHGLAVHEGINLKSLILLSALDGRDWGTYELESVETMARTAIGGSLIYIHFFRGKILDRMQVESEGFELYKQMEQNLAGLCNTTSAPSTT